MHSMQSLEEVHLLKAGVAHEGMRSNVLLQAEAQVNARLLSMWHSRIFESTGPGLLFVETCWNHRIQLKMIQRCCSQDISGAYMQKEKRWPGWHAFQRSLAKIFAEAIASCNATDGISSFCRPWILWDMCEDCCTYWPSERGKKNWPVWAFGSTSVWKANQAYPAFTTFQKLRLEVMVRMHISTSSPTM